jgi:hypothetical protein
MVSKRVLNRESCNARDWKTDEMLQKSVCVYMREFRTRTLDWEPAIGEDGVIDYDCDTASRLDH